MEGQHGGVRGEKYLVSLKARHDGKCVRLNLKFAFSMNKDAETQRSESLGSFQRPQSTGRKFAGSE